MSAEAWELIFLMFVLKLPIAYLVAVVVYAIRAQPEPDLAALVRADVGPRGGPCPWHAAHGRGPRTDRPRPRPRRVARGVVG
jgi:hypothetical protein